MDFAAPAGPVREMPALPPPPEDGSLRVLQVDFDQYGLPEIAGRTCIIIDNLFTPKDIAKLYNSATASVPNGEWLPAQVNVGQGRQVLNTDYRNSGRIILDSHELGEWVFNKIKPHLPAHVLSIPGAQQHRRVNNKLWTQAKEQSNAGIGQKVGKAFGVKSKEKEPTAKCVRLNERLRFLRYEKGMFFQPHFDGLYWTPDKKEVSYYTLQVYLKGPDGEEPPEGGATRILGREAFHRGWSTAEEGAVYVDVEPIPGRVLVFEQEGIPHSGELVTKGVKYSVRTDFMYQIVPTE